MNEYIRMFIELMRGDLSFRIAIFALIIIVFLILFLSVLFGVDILVGAVVGIVLTRLIMRFK